MTDNTDLIESPIDLRARRAAAELHRAAARQPIPNRTTRRPLNLLGPIVVVCTVAILAIGLVAMPRLRHDPPPATPAATEPTPAPLDARWVIGTPPAGWSMLSTQEPPADSPPQGPLTLLLSTPDAPNGAVAEIQPGITEFPPDDASVLNAADTSVDGVDVMTGDLVDGRSVAYSPAVQVLVTARNVPPDELVKLAAGITLDPHGSPAVAVGALPSGMKVASAAEAGNALVPIDIGSAPAAVVTYVNGVTSHDSMFLAVAPDTGRSAAFLDLQLQHIDAINLPDHVIYIGTDPSGTVQATWVANGLAFTIHAVGLTEEQVVEASRTVRPASATEWSAADATQTAPTVGD